MSIHSRLFAPVLVLILIGGCTPPPATKAYHERSELSKAVAELCYKGLYAAFTRGHVSQADLDLARQYYEDWQQSQRLYIDQTRAGGEPTPEVQTQLRRSLLGLLHLAERYQVL